MHLILKIMVTIKTNHNSYISMKSKDFPYSNNILKKQS